MVRALAGSAASSGETGSNSLVLGSLAAHSGFFWGLGDFPSFMAPAALLGTAIAAAEPANALTIPTWVS